MKIVGFITEHNPISNSLSYKDYEKGANYSKIDVLNYLNNGIKIGTTLEIVKSLVKGDGAIIGGIVYFTDGIWIWPNYLSYYIEKESIGLPRDFLENISNSLFLEKDRINIEKAINYLKENIL